MWDGTNDRKFEKMPIVNVKLFLGRYRKRVRVTLGRNGV